MLYQESWLKRELLGLVIGRYNVRILTGTLTVLSEVNVAFPVPVGKCEHCTETKLQSLPSKSFSKSLFNDPTVLLCVALRCGYRR
jgi:hypothetical protein